MDDLRLSTYPYVIVRMACLTCRRLGSYRLARLAARFGPETPLAEVLNVLAGNCPGKGIKRHKGSYPVCGITLPDVEGSTPADLPHPLARLPPSRAVGRRD